IFAFLVKCTLSFKDLARNIKAKILSIKAYVLLRLPQSRKSSLGNGSSLALLRTRLRYPRLQYNPRLTSPYLRQSE
ncbi:hypothetical protein VN97_g13297, partial [Penicillium thymicola]